MWGLDGKRPTDGPKLAYVEKARSCQSGHVFIEIDARIDVGIEITNRKRWRDGVAVDDDRVKGASSQAASWTQPDEPAYTGNVMKFQTSLF